MLCLGNINKNFVFHFVFHSVCTNFAVMISEDTIKHIKEMLARSESRDVIAHCDYIIENEDTQENEKFISQLFYLRGNAYRQLGDWGKAMSSYLESTERDPESPAKQAYAHALEILDFYNHDLYNP